MKKTFKFLLLFSIITFSGYATTYYVSPTGTGTGTISSPLSFTTAIAKALVAGDSLLLRDGMYSFSSLQQISKSGTSAKFIFIGAYKAEIPILDFRNEPYNSSNQGVKLSGNYVHLKDIIIQGAGDNGLQVTGSNNKIEHCTARWNCDSGFQMKTGSDNLILNCDSYENFDYETSGSIGGNADGFADKQYTNTGTNTYKGCRSWSNSDDGWDSYEKVGNTVYDSCWCYNLGPASFDMTNNIRYTIDKTYIDGYTNHIIPNAGNGNGFKMGGNYTANNATAHHCIAIANKVKGFDQNNNNGIMTVYNCTSYNNGNNYGYSNSTYGTLIIKNCASLSSKGSNSFACKSVTQAYNSWNTGFSCVTGDFVSLDYTQMLNPRQADGSLPEITLLHLTGTSNLLNKGTNVGYSFLGSAPDLGAFEYNNITTVLNPSDNQQNNFQIFVNSDRSIIIKGQIASVEVYELTGRKLYSKQEVSDIQTISGNYVSKGIFLVRIVGSDGQVQTNKILIQ